MSSFNDSSPENIVAVVGEPSSSHAHSNALSLEIHNRHQLAITLIQNDREAKIREIKEKNKQIEEKNMQIEEKNKQLDEKNLYIEELKGEKINMKQEIQELRGIIASLTNHLHESCQNIRHQNLGDVDSVKV